MSENNNKKGRSNSKEGTFYSAIQNISCEKCGSGDVEKISDEFVQCKHCGSKIHIANPSTTNIVTNNYYIGNVNSMVTDTQPKENKNPSDMQPNTAPKKRNIFARLWFYFSTYEKLWLLTLWALGITFTILFPELEDGTPENLVDLVLVLSVITLMGGCSCELLLSKQSKWAFIVSFFFYDLTFTTVCLLCGRYVTALVEFVFWMPMLFISFFSWDKRKDKEDKQLAVVKKINFHKELLIFVLVLAASIGLGLLFTEIEPLIEGGWFDFTDMWYLDALAACFNVCNGLFLWLRYREQWIAWYGVIICESIFYIMSQNWALLVLELGYLTNTTYGFFKWGRYIKKHKNQDDYAGKVATTTEQSSASVEA